MKSGLLLAVVAALSIEPLVASPADDADFRAIYRTLVETDTTAASGTCTLAATKMADALALTGMPPADLHPYSVASHPREGGLVAIVHGTDPHARPLLLVAHIDVVDAKRADWARDPFVLSEEGGYFYGRGVSDNKAMAAAMVESLIRLRRANVLPRRDVKIALTCGEETATAFNGAHYLATQRRDLIDAGLAFVPSGGATLDSAGRPIEVTLQTAEKTRLTLHVTARGTGSHASRPTPDNAITTLAASLVQLAAYGFPIELTPAIRHGFEHIASTAAPDRAAVIRSWLAAPTDTATMALVTANPAWNAMLRTTCVATMIDTGRQANTIAIEASATVDCRLLPGTDPADVLTRVRALLATPHVRVEADPVEPVAVFPPIAPAMRRSVEHVIDATWPGVPVVSAMLTGATDARHFNAAGIPTYGITLVFNDPDGNGVHTVDERVRVRSVLDGRNAVYRLIMRFAR